MGLGDAIGRGLRHLEGRAEAVMVFRGEEYAANVSTLERAVEVSPGNPVIAKVSFTVRTPLLADMDESGWPVAGSVVSDGTRQFRVLEVLRPPGGAQIVVVCGDLNYARKK